MKTENEVENLRNEKELRLIDFLKEGGERDLFFIELGEWNAYNRVLNNDNK